MYLYYKEGLSGKTGEGIFTTKPSRSLLLMVFSLADVPPARGCTNFEPAFRVGNRGMVSLPAQKPMCLAGGSLHRGKIAADHHQGAFPQGPLQENLKVRAPAVHAAKCLSPQLTLIITPLSQESRVSPATSARFWHTSRSRTKHR